MDDLFVAIVIALLLVFTGVTIEQIHARQFKLSCAVTPREYRRQLFLYTVLRIQYAVQILIILSIMIGWLMSIMS